MIDGSSGHMGTLESIYRSIINTVPPQPEAQLPMRPNKMSFSRMDPQHVCVLCDQTFSKKSNLVRHMNNTHHQVSVKQECADCGKTFNRKDNLKQHQSICQHWSQVRGHGGFHAAVCQRSWTVWQTTSPPPQRYESGQNLVIFPLLEVAASERTSSHYITSSHRIHTPTLLQKIRARSKRCSPSRGCRQC